MTDRQIYEACLKLKPHERSAYIDNVCGTDDALRQRVEHLLKLQNSSLGLIERPTIGESQPENGTQAYVPSATHDVSPGATIAGRYKIMQELGEGGMGTVYVAEQREPVKRLVALKLIKTGMNSKVVLTRFEAERQALALMDHPHIAKMLDGGITDQNQPYFVMELVKGVPINKYCDQAHLTPKERLELFIPVCQAVQHAHQKGIIHRDLKPSNILVGLYDGKPVAKVIDFGVAKAVHQKLTERTMYTEVGSIIGTLEYMAPEQAELNNLDIDTRADIYALGVILYELLTGSTPFNTKQLRGAAFDEMLRMIREEEPQKPSTKLSSSEKLSSIAATRKLEPKRLTAMVAGELDWIVMKCLEKDRGRRYETANGLAADIQRYLGGEAVLAGPPSRWYRISKFVKRNKVQVIAAGLVFLTLLGGIVGTSWQAYEANQARIAEGLRAESEHEAKLDAIEQKKQAQAAGKLASDRLRLVEAEKKRADTEKHIAFTVNDFLQNKLLHQANATAQADSLSRIGKFELNVRHNPTICELLDRAALELTPDKIEVNLPKAPMVQASILRTLGRTYGSIGEYSKSIEFLKRSIELYQANLAKDDPVIILAQEELAVATSDSGNRPEAIKLFQQVLAAREKQQGRTHQDYLSLQCSLAETYRRSGKLLEALELLLKVRESCETSLGPEHRLTLFAMSNLAGIYLDTAKYQDAVKLLKEVSEVQKMKLIPDHPDTLRTLTNLALAYEGAGKYPQAIELGKVLRKKSEQTFGKEDMHTVAVIHGLAVCAQATGKYSEAVKLFEEILPIMDKTLGTKHIRTLTARSNLGVSLIPTRQLSKAIQILEKVKEDQETTLGKNHPETLPTLNGLGVAYWESSQFDKAILTYEDALKRADKLFGRSHMMTLYIMANLGVNYNASGRLNEGIPLLEEAYRNRTVYPQLAPFESQLLNGYVQAKRVKEAKPMIEKNIARDRSRFPAGSVQLAGVLSSHGSQLLRLELFADAEPILRECYDLRLNSQSVAWTTFFSQSQLGCALLGQKKHVEAEPLLKRGYQGLVEHEKEIPLQGKYRLREALEHLVQLYTETNKPDEAANWQKELDAHNKKYATPAPAKKAG